MPRPYPPPLLPYPTVEPFAVDSTDRPRLARALGLTQLPEKLVGAINEAIARYKTTQCGNRDTTKGNTLAALAELYRPGRSYEAALSRLASDQCGVDYTTLDRLQPLVRAALAGDPEAPKALAAAAKERAAELRNHPRIAPETESLRFFCGVLRVIFDAAASPSMDRTWHNCARFALEVFAVAGIEHADFDAHPERLKEYLATDVTSD
jgi:hypothetical protein